MHVCNLPELSFFSSFTSRNNLVLWQSKVVNLVLRD